MSFGQADARAAPELDATYITTRRSMREHTATCRAARARPRGLTGRMGAAIRFIEKKLVTLGPAPAYRWRAGSTITVAYIKNGLTSHTAADDDIFASGFEAPTHTHGHAREKQSAGRAPAARKGEVAHASAQLRQDILKARARKRDDALHDDIAAISLFLDDAVRLRAGPHFLASRA